MNVNAVGFSVGGALTVEAETGFDAKNGVRENQEKGITEEERLSITWAITPAPPFFIFEGKYRAQGICDALVKQLKPIMSDVKHETVVMPQSRVNAEKNVTALLHDNLEKLELVALTLIEKESLLKDEIDTLFI